MSGDAPTPKTVLVHEHDPATLPAAKKQRSGVSADAVPEEAKPKRSFKTIANLVVAMKRFQGEHPRRFIAPTPTPRQHTGEQSPRPENLTADRASHVLPSPLLPPPQPL
jgi:hypothetical protein